MSPVLAVGGGGTDTAKATGTDWSAAKRAVAAREFEKALPLLRRVVAENPTSPNVYNYLGYADARMGRMEEAQKQYRQALAIEPAHKSANEYLGELFLKLGDLAGAEERLKVLDNPCTFGCPEFDPLREAVAYCKQNGIYESRKGL